MEETKTVSSCFFNKDQHFILRWALQIIQPATRQANDRCEGNSSITQVTTGSYKLSNERVPLPFHTTGLWQDRCPSTPSDWFGNGSISVYKRGRGDACRGFWKERLALPPRGGMTGGCELPSWRGGAKTETEMHTWELKGQGGGCGPS